MTEVKYFISPEVFIAEKTGAEKRYIANLLKLLEGGATIPFIARYRKEMTGSMDEVRIAELKSVWDEFQELEKRKTTVIETITQQEKMTDALMVQIRDCREIRVLEDIYLPYKPKKTTRATKARERGLEPLALLIMMQKTNDLNSQVRKFITDEVPTDEDALQGARDIIAEMVCENEKSRNTLRRVMERTAVITAKVVKGKEADGEKYEQYFDFSEPLKKCPSHRLLAIRRAENEGFIRFGLKIEDSDVLEPLERIFIRERNSCAQQIKTAVQDSYKRLLFPAIESEYLGLAKVKADTEAIRVFAENLRQLLLASPLGGKRVLAIDPGYRTGCKVVCLSETGQLLHNEAIFPHPPQNQTAASAAKVINLVRSYNIEAIAIGNGTAGRESEQFVRNLHLKDIQIFMVDESGASVYSASAIAREEFPSYDVTVRGAVSIGRRLMDPLAELVKIDPKSIGVGQYQHDVDQTKLKESLDFTVESCVNSVGVNVNTAGKYLLQYVSGLGASLAANIEDYIKENGALTSRAELKKVKRMGPKAYEQSAGFLRIRNADNPLDASAVHPESYHIVEQMAKDLGITTSQLIGNSDLCDKIDIKQYVTENVGIPTLLDIVKELKKPGLDPRAAAEEFRFDENIHKPEDLKAGMILNGIVTNITNFGAFVDVGVKQDGLVHVSEISDRYITDPASALSLRQKVRVIVLDVEPTRKRISLSIRKVPKE